MLHQTQFGKDFKILEYIRKTKLVVSVLVEYWVTPSKKKSHAWKALKMQLTYRILILRVNKLLIFIWKPFLVDFGE